MPERDIIVVGASAGGVEALQRLVADLPADLPAAVLIVLHIPPTAVSVMPQILDRAGSLPAAHPVDGEPLTRGRIYVAPPDRHLVVRDNRVHTVHGPRENRSRPAVDPLFRSAALAHGERVIGVVLTGSLDDGTAGLLVVKQMGGVTVVQDPQDALFPGMPTSALEHVEVDHCLPLAEIPPLLVRLTGEDIRRKGRPVMTEKRSDLDQEARVDELDLKTLEDDRHPGARSPYGCPECGGAMWEISDGEFVRYRCRIGHAFSGENLLAAQSDGLESALWIALRTLEEKVSLASRLEQRAREQQQHGAAGRFREQAESSHQAATVIRELLLTANGWDAPDLRPDLTEPAN